MAEYIEREAAKKEFNLNFGGVSHAVIANRILDALPAADVVPVVHGRWIEHIDPLPWCEDDVDVFWKCSACESPNFAVPPYCPNCGARMDGDGNCMAHTCLCFSVEEAVERWNRRGDTV